MRGALKVQVPGSGLSAGGGSSDDSEQSRANSLGAVSTNPAPSLSANSPLSYLHFEDIIRTGNEPGSAGCSSGSGHSGGAVMERDNSMQGLDVDLDKLSLEKGRELDVEDLDDIGWKAAKRDGLIVELGSLGEGAGGAVNKCILKGGKTIFALKVCHPDEIFL